MENFEKKRNKKEGLYDPRNEHDSCGLGFIANIKGAKSHDIVKKGIFILENLERDVVIRGITRDGCHDSSSLVHANTQEGKSVNLLIGRIGRL